mmetsp:Transcript_132403/g.264133  ORF Transcript_132403/g.264133 Transcript_132403/m.264133 type:complete len:253 (+) Transcript_132403:1-759(+)
MKPQRGFQLMVILAESSGSAMAGTISGQADAVNLRAAELTWNPDTDLLMSKLRDVKDDQEAENLLDANLRHLLNFLNLQCCCADSTTREPPAEKATFGTPLAAEICEPTTSTSVPEQGLDADDIPTLALNYPPRTREDIALSEVLPKPDELKPPVFSHDQTPYNSPRSSKRKQMGASSSKSKVTGRKPGILNMSKSSLHKRRMQGTNFVIEEEEEGFVPDDSDSDASIQDVKQKPRPRQTGCCNPLRRLARA